MAMSLEDRIKIVVEAEVARAVNSLKNVQAEAVKTESTFGKVQASLPKLKTGFGLLGLSIGAVSTAFTVFIKRSYDIATSMQASGQVVDRLFQNNSQSIKDFAANVDESFGISEKAALQYSATYGNLFMGFIKNSDELENRTKEMLKQSAVIASATGRSIEDVNERIRSGLLGSTEAIEDLGINVNVAMIESTDAFKRFAGDGSWAKLDFNMQQQIRLAAILEQSYKKYGGSLNDNVTTSTNKLAASFENLQGEIGRTFVPLAEEMLPKIADQLKDINDNYLNDIIAGIKLTGNAVAIVVDTVGLFVDELKAGSNFLVYTILAPITEIVEALSKLKVGQLIDMTGLEPAAKFLKEMTEAARINTLAAGKSAVENSNQVADSFSSMWQIISGESEKVSQTVTRTAKTAVTAVDSAANALKGQIDAIAASFTDLKDMDELELKVKLTPSEIDDAQLEMRKALNKAFEDNKGDLPKYERLAELIKQVYGKAVDEIRQKEADAAKKSVQDAEYEARSRQEIIDRFNIDYLHSIGSHEEAIRLSLDKEIAQYDKAGVDKLALQSYYQTRLNEDLEGYASKDKNAEILLNFEQEYLKTTGRFNEAAKMAIEEQAKIYLAAGADRVKVEAWANDQILNSSTSLFDGIKRGIRDISLETSDYASLIEGTLKNAFSGAEDALVQLVTTGKADFSSLVDSIIADIARMAVRAAITEPLSKALNGLMSNIGGSLFNGSSKTGTIPPIDFGVATAHASGIAGQLPATRTVSADLLANAQRYHNGGLIGSNEVPIIAKRGERVLNERETAAYDRRTAGTVNITVNNNSNSQVSIDKKQNNQGGFDIEFMIGDIVAKQAGTSGTAVSNTLKMMQSNPLVRR